MVLLRSFLQVVKFFMRLSSDRICLLVKDYVSCLGMSGRHAPPVVEQQVFRIPWAKTRNAAAIPT
jgi:hypothetical protein